MRGAVEFGEPGVFIAFEETAEELAQNVRSLGFDLDELIAQKKIAVDYVHVERARSRRPASTTSTACSSGLALAIDPSARSASCSTRSRRCSAASRIRRILRAELRRLFRWLKDKGVTASSRASAATGR